jgi:hypothetical protein
MEKLRSSLGRLRGQQWEPSKLQVWIWQVPSLLLVVSIFLFGVGLNLQIWIAFAKYRKDVVVRSLDSTAQKLLVNLNVQRS